MCEAGRRGSASPRQPHPLQNVPRAAAAPARDTMCSPLPALFFLAGLLLRCRRGSQAPGLNAAFVRPAVASFHTSGPPPPAPHDHPRPLVPFPRLGVEVLPLGTLSISENAGSTAPCRSPAAAAPAGEGSAGPLLLPTASSCSRPPGSIQKSPTHSGDQREAGCTPQAPRPTEVQPRSCAAAGAAPRSLHTS